MGLRAERRKKKQEQELVPPKGVDKVLLHSCCAPCSGEVIRAMHEAGVEITLYFYNPNIHPRREYELRKDENKRYCEEVGITFVDDDYNKDEWFERTEGMEWEPEKGVRCTTCFDMRFERAADYAKAHGFKVFTSCLGISRWKDMDQITNCGIRAASAREGISYWAYNWRKGGGAQRMYSIAKDANFYKQEYCGCVYSLRDTNAARVARGLQPIRIGEEFYGCEIYDQESGAAADSGEPVAHEGAGGSHYSGSQAGDGTEQKTGE